MNKEQIEAAILCNDKAGRIIETPECITYVSFPKHPNKTNVDFLLTHFDFVDRSRYDITVKRRK